MKVLNEAIDVRVNTTAKRSMPVSFVWRGRSYNITQTTLPAVNKRRDGAWASYFVRNDQQKLFKISYDISKLRWYLNYVLD
jgi:hypothetical protein